MTINITTALLDYNAVNSDGFDGHFAEGVDQADWRARHTDLIEAEDCWAEVRAKWGFVRVASPLDTAPADNAKLDRSLAPAYGWTFQHMTTTIDRGTRLKPLVVNACPNAGHCGRVCVLDHGNGGYDTVQRARKARTEFLVEHTGFAAYLLGRQLRKAVLRHSPLLGGVLLRPNVNSDIQWERVAPKLVNGEIMGVHNVVLYGYTKLTDVLDTDGWVGNNYRVAYSWNEKSAPLTDEVEAFRLAGGSVAVVTNRKPKQPVDQWQGTTRIMDADLTDEWIFQQGVYGDLSAKGKARRLIGNSDFVVMAY